MEASPAPSPGWPRSVYWPELVLAVSACLILLGFLGRPQLWGKREQRAAAEALDTVENRRWLVAEIQGRPRLEKPPLPRWCAASLFLLSGRASEALVRLPSALSGLATVALVYAFGLRLGGRSLALVSASALCSSGIFVAELRQAGNDGMLGLFTTLALYAAWRRLQGSPSPQPGPCSPDSPDPRPWDVVFWTALGLGFLCKGPVILLLVGTTVLPYLACTGRLKARWSRLFSTRGCLAFLALALSWPLAVIVHDPEALGVWLTEMGQKTGALPIRHREREVLGLMFPLLALPWPVLGFVGVLLPLLNRRRVELPWGRSDVWFPWWWAVGNLILFSGWAVAKPNYYVPCLPGLAILVGMAWLRLCRLAKGSGTPPSGARLARFALGSQWGLLMVSGVLLPQLVRRNFEAVAWPLLAAIACLAWAGAGIAAALWRRGLDHLAPLPIVASLAAGVLAGYGYVAPLDDPTRGHSRLAGELDRLLPPHVKTLHFFHEIDEGLWFYLRGRRLVPVPGSQPRRSDSYDNLGGFLGPPSGAMASAPSRPNPPGSARREGLLDWLRAGRPAGEPLLLKASVFDRLAADLGGLAVPLHREQGLKRNELVLLRAAGAPAPSEVAASAPAAPSPARR